MSQHSKSQVSTESEKKTPVPIQMTVFTLVSHLLLIDQGKVLCKTHRQNIFIKYNTTKPREVILNNKLAIVWS